MELLTEKMNNASSNLRVLNSLIRDVENNCKDYDFKLHIRKTFNLYAKEIKDNRKYNSVGVIISGSREYYLLPDFKEWTENEYEQIKELYFSMEGRTIFILPKKEIGWEPVPLTEIYTEEFLDIRNKMIEVLARKCPIGSMDRLYPNF